MSEHDEPRSKSGGCLRLLMWGFVALIAIVVIAGIAASIVTRRVNTSYAAEITRIKAAGDPVSVADLALPAIPDSENGAKDIEAALALLPKLSADDRRFFEAFSMADDSAPSAEDTAKLRALVDAHFIDGAGSSVEDVIKLRTLVGAHLPALERARQGFGKSRIAFPRDLDQRTCPITFKDIRFLARTMCRASDVAALEGRGDEAIGWAADAFRLGDALSGEPAYTTHLVGVAVRGLAYYQARAVLGKAAVSPSRLREMSALCAAAQARLRGDLVVVLKGERALAISQLEEMITREEGPAVAISRIFIHANLSTYLGVMRGWIADMADPAVSLPAAGWQVPPMRGYEALTALLLLEGLAPMPTHYAGYAARMRTAAIGLEVAARVAEGASAPADLSSFDAGLRTDPYSGKPLMVKTDTATWTVYSLGKNGKDDGGVAKDSSAQTNAPTPDDIAFTIPLKRAD